MGETVRLRETPIRPAKQTNSLALIGRKCMERYIIIEKKRKATCKNGKFGTSHHEHLLSRTVRSLVVPHILDK